VPDVLVPYMGGTTFIPFVRSPPVNANAAKMAKAKSKKDSGDAGDKGKGKGKGGKGKGGKSKGGDMGKGSGQAAQGKAAAPKAVPVKAKAAAPKASVPAAAMAAPSSRGPAEGRPALRCGGVGLAHLNARLAALPYVGGFAASTEDAAVLRLLEAAPMAAAGVSETPATATGTLLAAAAAVALGAVVPPAHHVRYPHLVRWLKRTQAMRPADWKVAGVPDGAVLGFEAAPVSAYFRG